MITHTRKVLDTAATDHDDGVLLQVVADAGNVARDLDLVGEADTGDLTKGGVRLLGGGGVNAGADAALLGAVLKSGALRSLLQFSAAFAHQLGNRRHACDPIMNNAGHSSGVPALAGLPKKTAAF